MGYNTWNDVGCNGVSEDYIKKVADAFIEHGLDKLGYKYINVDDCWASSRDGTTKQLMPDPTLFPSGISGVAAHVHSKGLKFGLYTDRGVWTCGARPGSSDFEVKDAQTFAEWGVDYLKVDSCNAPQNAQGAIAQFVKMRDALNATGRPIFYAMCGWMPWYAEVGQAVANSWRIARDVNGICELWNTISINSALANFAGPGAWNDPDALVSSTEGHRVHMVPQHSRTQFSLWAIMAAPLILSADVHKLSAYDWETYTNVEVINVDQDELGRQGTILWESCPPRDVAQLDLTAKHDRYPLPPPCQQIWGRLLTNDEWAVVMVNWAMTVVEIVLQEAHLQRMGFAWGAHVPDLWEKQDLGMYVTNFSRKVEGNGHSVMLRLTPRRAFV